MRAVELLADGFYAILMGGIGVFNFLLSIFARIFGIPVRAFIKRTFKRFGIEINGKEPWDMQVTNNDFYRKFAVNFTLGLGESYMDGDWDCDQLEEFSARLIGTGGFKYLMSFPHAKFFHYLQFKVFNLQTVKKSSKVADKHYNLGNKLFQSFLDETMNYSCGYWKDAKNLSEAQQHKMEMIGRKLKLSPGMKVLDIGCGWSGLCKYLAETYQVHVVGINNAIEMAKYGQELCKDTPNVQIRCQDYRELRDGKEVFDRVVSVGMFEHVGAMNYRMFFETVDKCLTPDGLFLCHSIGKDSDNMFAIEPFCNKYIFPYGCLPDHSEITKSIRNIFTIEDWHNLGPDYDKTLCAWIENFKKNWPSISHEFDDPKRFYRMWTFYLGVAAGFFRCRGTQLWQIVYSKCGNREVYRSER